jgi:cytosine/adenosine deaminase-related metal-dependent hydrolase
VTLGHLAPGDLDILAQGQLTPVYCPRSHAFFGHANHPAAEILQSGIPLAIGTDSLASNTGLDMLGELKLARRLHAQVSASTWLRCATLTGATALRLADTVGSLTPGKTADLCVIRMGSHTDSAPDLADLLLASDSTAIATMIAGKWVYTTAGGEKPAAETC